MSTAEQTEVQLPLPCDQNRIHLPLGLLGFERFKNYLWRQRPEEAPFHWLEAVDAPELAFVVAAPADVVGEYAPDISDEDAAFLKLSSPSDACIYGIVTLRPHGGTTINLKGPIVLNRFTLRGKQVVPVNAAAFSLQHRLLGPE